MSENITGAERAIDVKDIDPRQAGEDPEPRYQPSIRDAERTKQSKHDTTVAT